MFFNKKPRKVREYDKEKLVPMIRASICNGEQVAGFKNLTTGDFIEETFILSPKDLEGFKEKYGITDIKTEY